MPSNFDFLQIDWPDLHEDAVHTERDAFAAPRTCAFYARRTLERAVKWLYAHDSYLRMPYQDNLAALIHEQTFKDTLAPGLFNSVRMIHKIGNLAVHSDTNINPQDGLQVTKCLHAILAWLAKAYTQGAPSVATFDESLVPDPGAAPAADKTAEQLQALQDKYRQKDAAFDQAQEQLATTQEEVDRLKAQIQAIKEANKKAAATEKYTEAETRDLFIDLMLREAGWDPHGENVEEYEVTGMPNKTGLGYVDYVLWGEDGKPLAVVEAKKTKVDPHVGQRQAELYADCLEKATGQRPVIFYTNGYETWLWDDTIYPSREVQGFYTRDELQLMVHRRTTRQDITKAPVNTSIVDRYYHEAAVRHVMENYGRDKSRKALLVMATGSGKTRLSIASVELLMKNNWVRRVLFLADRTALLRQAKNAFNKFLPHASLVNLVEEKDDGNARVVFSTYPTMMNMIDDTRSDGQKQFGVGHFDLIIIDEAHRSVYQEFGAIFDYFDGMLLGLTATPKAEVDKNTYHLFELEDDVPTYAYELDQAVSDGFLVPPKAVSVPLKFVRQGVAYSDLSDDDKAEYEDKFYDDDSGLPAQISAGAINKWLFNEDTVDKVLGYLMEHGLKVEGGDRLGKSIIFAKNHHHATFIEERFNKCYPHLAGKFLRVIDNQVKYAQSLIDDLYIADKAPHIAVSVDMLDTGIDVPELVNLVFFKLVYSKTKFWQMVGRGTRTCSDLFGPGVDKEFFYIFDYCQNLEFFGEKPDGYEAPIQESVKTKVFRRRLTLAHQLQDQSKGQAEANEPLGQLRGELADQLHETVKRMDVNNFFVRPHRKYVEQFGERERWDHLTTGDVGDASDHLAPLPTKDDDEEFARRFDLLLLNLQLAILESDHAQERYQQQVRDLASGLEEKRAIPSVAAQMELILEIQTDEYWECVTLPMLERARRKLRDLIRFIDRAGGREHVYTNLEDEIGEGVEVPGIVKQDPSLKNYRLKMEKFIREHAEHPTIERIRKNIPICEGDIDSLEAILFSEDGPGTREEFETTYGTDQPLGKLVRRIIGLDRGAAKEAFGSFLSEAPLTGDQITFVSQIIDHLVINGIMDPAALFEPPFNDFHDEGVLGVLPDHADSIVAAIRQVNANATVGDI